MKLMGLRKLDNFIPYGRLVPTDTKPNVPGPSLKQKEHGEIPAPARPRPLSAEWISEDLLLETRKLWSKAYGHVISIDEAVEILMNVKRLAEVLVRIYKENQVI
jgi:hypothetical protein